jgi:acyl-homoserine lactone acylase PvdQ
MSETEFDPEIVEAVEWALAVHFTQNQQPCMSGDPRHRLSSLQRRNMELACQDVLCTLHALGYQQVGADQVVVSRKLLSQAREVVQHEITKTNTNGEY